MLIRTAHPDEPAARVLLDALSAHLLAAYGSDGRHGLEGWQAGAPGWVFLLEEGVACGAVRPREDDPACGELKRMYAAVPGAGRHLLAALESAARAAGYARLSLSTRLANTRARAFYARNGFVPCAPWGGYRTRPECCCLQKDLAG